MSRIDELVQDLCPKGIEYRSLGEVGEFTRGSGLQKADLREQGVPAVHYGQIHTHYGVWATETKSFTDESIAAKLRHAKPGDLLIATTSEDDEAVAKATAWLGGADVVLSGDAYIYRHTLEPKYMAYFFQSSMFQDQKRRFISGTKVRRVSGASLAKIRIPVPPLEVQREIVRVLAQFTQLEAELEAELEARRAQYKHYLADLLTFDPQGTKWVTLGDVCNRVFSGGTPLSTRRDFYDGGSIPWLRTKEVAYGLIEDTEVKITQAAVDNSSARWVKPNSVIVAISGAGVTRGRASVNKIALTTNQHCCNLEVDPARANYRFVYQWLVRSYEHLRSRGQGNRSDLNVGLIKAYPIPLPVLKEQERIATILDDLEALTSDLNFGLPAELNARRKQYEHYRDRLLRFKELTA